VVAHQVAADLADAGIRDRGDEGRQRRLPTAAVQPVGEGRVAAAHDQQVALDFRPLAAGRDEQAGGEHAIGSQPVEGEGAGEQLGVRRRHEESAGVRLEQRAAGLERHRLDAPMGTRRRGGLQRLMQPGGQFAPVRRPDRLSPAADG
jgi:hypothetical protein